MIQLHNHVCLTYVDIGAYKCHGITKHFLCSTRTHKMTQLNTCKCWCDASIQLNAALETFNLKGF